MEESKYNKWYKRIKEEGLPQYLRKGWGERRWRRVVRFRLGNEIREERYWEEEEGRLCRWCEREEESWKHVWEECRDWGMEERGSWQEEVGWVLGEEGEGEWWMRKVEKEREKGGGMMRKGGREEIGGKGGEGGKEWMRENRGG